MENNNTYNLMHQLTQESKSLWRIKHNYTNEALSHEERTFWEKLLHEKEQNVAILKDLIKKAL